MSVFPELVLISHLDELVSERWAHTGHMSGTLEPERLAQHRFSVQKTKWNAYSLGVSVGRIASNDVSIPHHSVSRFHASLQEEKGGWFIRDADSKNGTFLDTERLEPNRPYPLKHRTRLQFGEVVLVFMLPELE